MNIRPLVSKRIIKEIYTVSAELAGSEIHSFADYIFQTINKHSRGHSDLVMLGLCKKNSRGELKDVLFLNGADNHQVKKKMEMWQNYWLRNYFFTDYAVIQTMHLLQQSDFHSSQSDFRINDEFDEINRKMDEEFVQASDLSDIINFKLLDSEKFVITLSCYKNYSDKVFHSVEHHSMRQYIRPIFHAIEHLQQHHPEWENYLNQTIQEALEEKKS